MVTITGSSLSPEDVEAVAFQRDNEIRLDPDAEIRVHRARDCVQAFLDRGERAYGITTGFGRLSEVFIAAPRRAELQLNLVRSHASGVGDVLSVPEVRAIMVARANVLARGHSGCRVDVIQRLLEMLRFGITPVVPGFGSVGASGDLAPLAAIALAVVGEGTVEADGQRISTAEALRCFELEPLALREKEGLALINGTEAATGPGALLLLAAERALESIEVAGAMSSEGLRATPEPFREEVHAARPHPGQIMSAARLRALLRDSEIRESHRHNDPRVHDAYSIRCMPQVHGAARDILGYLRQKLEVELNSSTDNPLIFPDRNVVVSAGNFHAQTISQALDFLAIGLADLASISERRIDQLLNPDLSNLPGFLARDPGVQSGFMIAHVTAVDLLSDMRVLAHPASIDSVPTSAGTEDHVAMSAAAYRKARRSLECLEYIIAIELLCGAQALEFLKPLKPGAGVQKAYALVRRAVDELRGDRVLTGDIEAVRELVRQGLFASIAIELAKQAR